MMNQLSKHIIQLLERNECVILPGLGGFITTHVAAHYDEEKGMFMPPFRTLAFQTGLTTNDGLLAQSYMESGDLAYPDAVALVGRDISRIKEALSKDGYYDLEGIGRLSQDMAGNYYFSAAISENNDFSPEFYGLQPVNRAVLSARQPKKVAHVEVPVRPKQTVEAYPFYSKKGISIHLSTSTINKIAGVVIMFLLVFLFATPFGTLKPVTSYSGFASSLLENVKPVAKVRKATVTVVVPPKDSIKTSAAAPKTEPEEEKGAYCIVLASGVTHANATIFIKELAKNDIKAAVLEKGKMRRVVYSSFKSKEAAQAELSSLRTENDAFATAWVMKN